MRLPPFARLPFACLPIACLIASAAPAAPPAATGDVQLSPGQWEMTTTVEKAEMPGAPPFLAGLLKGRPVKVSHCLTADEAAKGPQELMKTSDQCRFTRYEAAGGKVDAVMVCTHDGGTTTATSSGNYTATGFTARGAAVTAGPQAMTMTAATTGRRTGDCK